MIIKKEDIDRFYDEQREVRTYLIKISDLIFETLKKKNLAFRDDIIECMEQLTECLNILKKCENVEYFIYEFYDKIKQEQKQ